MFRHISLRLLFVITALVAIYTYWKINNTPPFQGPRFKATVVSTGQSLPSVSDQFIEDFCKTIFDALQLEHGMSKSQPVAPSLNGIRHRVQIKPSDDPKIFEILISRRALGVDPIGVRILDISCQALARTKMNGCEILILQEIHLD